MAHAQLYRCSILDWYQATYDGVRSYPSQEFSFFYTPSKISFGTERGVFRGLELPVLETKSPRNSFEAGDGIFLVSFYDERFESNFVFAQALQGTGALIRAKCEKN